MDSQTLPLSTPGLVAVLRDIPTMQRWEILRRSQRPLTVAQLADEAQASVEVVQDSLDGLQRVGLVEQMRATARNPRICYRCPMQRLVISWNEENEIDLSLLKQMEDGSRAYSRSVIDGCDSVRRGPSPGRFGTLGVTSVQLSAADARTVRNAFRAAYATLVQAERRARESASPAPSRPFHITFEMRELNAPELPMAEVFMAELKQLADYTAVVLNAPSVVLASRELAIARELGEGRTRVEIAAKLGISENTVATASKRIYRKLGVHNRAELIERLKAA